MCFCTATRRQVKIAKRLADDELKPVMELEEPDLFQNDVVMEHGPIGTFDEMEAE